MNDLSSFDIYVLDKLEASLTPSRTVDERLYADTLEIECFYKRFGLGLLKLRLASEWSWEVPIHDEVWKNHTMM